jgi:hypothetical protein
MKPLLAAVLVIVSQIAFAPALSAAEEAKKPATAQQQRMRDCNQEATGLKGQERKDFMKQCLSGRQAANKEARTAQREEGKERKEVRQDAKTAQQTRMKACNTEAAAKALKGDERKAFMSNCLKS